MHESHYLTPQPWDEVHALGEEVVDVLLTRTHGARTSGDNVSSLNWARISASFMAAGFTTGHLSLPKLEEELLQIARKLPDCPPGKRRGHGPTCMHVLTEAYELFGHTKLCREWIRSDSSVAKHHVVLIDQSTPVPANLRQSVHERGGRLWVFGDNTAPLQKAELLRKLAYEHADIVILHAHPHDVIPTLAFGSPGGPPVIYVNHADHRFWVGGSIADLVVDIRESGAEWTQRFRAIPRSAVLPIPLNRSTNTRSLREKAQLREQARARLRVLPAETLFLTIGQESKYIPINGISFFDAAEQILKRCPLSKIVAVGPRPTGCWESLSHRTGGRILAIGNQSDLAPFHAAADVYLESMPFGSLTALLEACLSGLASVRAPRCVVPPFASDGAVFADVPQPSDLGGYVTEAVRLALDPVVARERSTKLAERVLDLHSGRGWERRLMEIRSRLPTTHTIYTLEKPQPIPSVIRDYWMEYVLTDTQRAYERLVLFLLLAGAGHSDRTRAILVAALEAQAKAGISIPDGRALLESLLPEMSKRLERVLTKARPLNIEQGLLIARIIRSAPKMLGASGWLCFAFRLLRRRPEYFKEANVWRAVASRIKGTVSASLLPSRHKKRVKHISTDCG